MERVRSYIEQHYAEALSIRDIAREFHASCDYIAHAFKHTTNYAPLQYCAAGASARHRPCSSTPTFP